MKTKEPIKVRKNYSGPDSRVRGVMQSFGQRESLQSIISGTSDMPDISGRPMLWATAKQLRTQIMTYRSCTGWSKNEATIFDCSYLQNVWTCNLFNFW